MEMIFDLEQNELIGLDGRMIEGVQMPAALDHITLCILSVVVNTTTGTSLPHER